MVRKVSPQYAGFGLTMKHGGADMIPFRRFCVILALALLAACDPAVNSAERAMVDLGSAEGCDASVQSCLLARDGVELRLELGKDIRSMQPFHLQLQIE